MTDRVLPYERLTDAISDAIHLWHGEHLLVRRPFRWHLDGQPIPNGYEMFGSRSVIEQLGMEVVESYGDHIFILKESPIPQSPTAHGRAEREAE